MINDSVFKLKLLTALLFMWLFIAESRAQSNPIDAPESVNETNIICYAAKSKWVCAPADDKQKAQEKAMKLALDSNDNSTLSQSVEIQTIAPNNISEQVQEVETPLQSSIKDFVSRDDAVNVADNKQDTADSNQNNPVITKPNEVHNHQPLVDSIETNQSAGDRADFSQWQSMYPSYWTFQVIGTSNRHHLDDFVLKHGLDQTSHHIVKTQANGADWWIVLSGLYNSREVALGQRDQLPVELSANAWVRQIKSIVGQAD